MLARRILLLPSVVEGMEEGVADRMEAVAAFMGAGVVDTMAEEVGVSTVEAAVAFTEVGSLVADVRSAAEGDRLEAAVSMEAARRAVDRVDLVAAVSAERSHAVPPG